MRTQRALVALMTCVATLTGCSLFRPVGPNYRAPVLPHPVLQTADEHVFSDALPPGPWWQLYQDPAINALVSEALSNNQDLRKAAANLERAQGALDASAAAGLPSTDVSLSGKRSRGEVDGLTGLHETTAFSDGLNVSYQLDLFGRIRRSVEAANATVEETRAAYAAAEITVAADTVRAYAQSCQAQAQIDTAYQALDLDTRLLTITRQEAAAGAVGMLDVSRAEAQQATTQATLPPLLASHRSALYGLSVLLGRPPEQIPAAALSCASAPTLQRVMPIGNGAALLRRRPDVREAERALAAATAQIGIATAALYPDVSLSASLGGAGTSPAALDRASGRTWSIGPLISWTFPNQAIARAQIRQSNAGADAALASFDSSVLNALKETETALQNYARELDHLQALQQALQADQRALVLARKLYEAGNTDLTSWLDAQRTVIAAQSQITTSQGDIASDQVSVFLALGGGWDDAASRAADNEAATRRERQHTLSGS